MTPEERDLLLARYATGQLSESELRRLREAALDDQELFDAMADEEELRDLLADPDALREVVKALEPPRSASHARRWPWVWAASGSLAAAAILAAVLFWKPREQPTEIAMQRPVETPAVAPQQPVAPPAVAPAIRANKVAPPPGVAEQAAVGPAAKPIPSESAELKKSTDESAQRSEVVPSTPLPAAQAPPVIATPVISGAVSSATSSWSVQWYLENADGTRKTIETGAEVDRGTTVLAEVHSAAGGSVRFIPALTARKEEQDSAEVFTPGETRVFRWRLDQAGPRQLTVTWLPQASAGAAAGAQRQALRDASVAPAGFKQSLPGSAQIFLRVR